MRAIRLYLNYLATGAPVAWDKTDHSYPSEDELMRYRHRLGDLLLDRRFVTVAQLDAALEQQRVTGRSLGSVLVDMGALEEDKLLVALGVQFGVQTTSVDPYAVDKSVIAMVPRDMAVGCHLFPVGLEANGRLILAVDVWPDPDEIHALEQKLERGIVLRLTTRGDLSFAIHYGYERLQREDLEEVLVLRLLERGMADEKRIAEARKLQRRGYRRLGDIFVALGFLSDEGLEELKKCVLTGQDMQLVGTCLLEKEAVTQEQLDKALQLQNKQGRYLTAILADMGVADLATLESLMTANRVGPA